MIISAEEAIRQAPPGACVYAMTRLEGGADELALLIRERSGIIADLGRAPQIEIRASLVREGDVYLIPLLTSIEGELYETWINYHAEGGRQAVECLAIQERLTIHLYDDDGHRARSLAIPHRRTEFWRGAARLPGASAPWSMAAFDATRETAYRRYPAVQALWDALRR